MYKSRRKVEVVVTYCTHFTFYQCRGPSMEPTIYSKDVILTEHITPRFNRISRGDVIIARSPSNPHHHICKRVTGLEGDRVKEGFKTHYVSFFMICVCNSVV